MNAKQLAFLASVVAAATLTACTGNVASPATAAPLSATPISHTYVVESHELIEVSRFEDGSMKYMPTLWRAAARSEQCACRWVSPRLQPFSRALASSSGGLPTRR